MRLLITGGAGCLGSNLVERYVPNGTEVMVIDNFVTSKREVLPEVPGILTAADIDILSSQIRSGTTASQYDLNNDGTHLNERGYDVWASVLRPIVRALSKPTPRATFRPAPTGMEACSVVFRVACPS